MTLDQFDGFVPIYNELVKLINEYMDLVQIVKCQYTESRVRELQVRISSIDDEMICVECYHSIYESKTVRFAWMIDAKVLLGDKSAWRASIIDYIQRYMPTWLPQGAT